MLIAEVVMQIVKFVSCAPATVMITLHSQTFAFANFQASALFVYRWSRNAVLK